MRKRLSDVNPHRQLRSPVPPHSPLFLSMFRVCSPADPFWAAGKSLGRIRIGLKGKVDMKWWLFRVIAVWRGSFDDCAPEHKTNDFSMAILEHWIPPVWIHNGNPLFTGNPEGKCSRTKQMTFQWQSRASQTHTTRLRWTAPHKSTLQSNTFGSVSAVHWQCIGHFTREWLRFTGGHGLSTERIELQWLQHTFGHQRERDNCDFCPPFLL